jgi:hypothetical protein
MKEITAEDKDRILSWFYEADVNGNVVPTEDKNLDICAILESDGYIEKGEYRHVITLKGRSFYLNGGYVKEREEKERPIKIAEEANKKARNANVLSFLTLVLSVFCFVFTYYNTKEKSIQETKETESGITNSIKDTTLIIVDTIKAVKPE